MISRNDIAEGFKTANKALKPKDRKRTMYIWKAKKNQILRANKAVEISIKIVKTLLKSEVRNKTNGYFVS